MNNRPTFSSAVSPLILNDIYPQLKAWVLKQSWDNMCDLKYPIIYVAMFQS